MAADKPVALGQSGRRRRGRRPRFTRELVAQAALELVDQEGLESLSMHRLAERLGIGTMTLYGYFRSKDELLEAVVDVAVKPSRRAREPSIEADWQDQLRSVVHAAHRTLSQHPALVQLRFRQPILRPEALRFGERIVGILCGAGFEPAEAASAFRLIFTYTFGFAGLSPARQTRQARDQAARAAAALPADEFPHLTATAEHWAATMAGPEQFSYGLERILDGLQTRVDAITPPRR